MNMNQPKTDYRRIIENNLNLKRGGEPRLIKHYNLVKTFLADNPLFKNPVLYGRRATPNDYAQLHEGIDRTTRHDIYEFMNKQERIDNKRGNFKKLKYGTNDFRSGGSVTYTKTKGLELAKAIHDARTPPEIEADRRNLDYTLRACEYLKRIDLMQARDKLEPRLKAIDEKFKEEWTKIYWYDLGLQTEWVNKLEYLFYLHRVHVSLKSPLQIAHYPTLRHLRDEREVVTKLGKYLTTFKDFIGIDDAVIKNIVEKYNAVIASRTGWEVKFIESNDPDGFENVYVKTKAGSCMSGNDGDTRNAVRVYAHDKSVIRLAYMVNGADEIIARCIVREDNKQYIRVYPDPNGSTEGRYLLDYLKANGYVHGNLSGCLLQAIQYEEDEDIFRAPYIDAGINGNGNSDSAQSGELVTIDDKEYIEICTSGDLNLTMTNGYTDDITDEDHEECEDCGHLEYRDDLYYTHHEQHICSDCIDSNYYYAHTRRGERDYVHGDYVVEVGDDAYHEDYLSEHDIYECEESGDYHHLDDLVNTSMGLIHIDYARVLDHEDLENNTYAHEDDAHELSDGTWCHKADAEELQAEIDEEEADELIQPSRPSDTQGLTLQGQTNENI